MSKIKTAAQTVGENIACLARRAYIVEEQTKISYRQLLDIVFEGRAAEDIPEAYADFCHRVADVGICAKTEFCKYVCGRASFAEYLENNFLLGTAEHAAAGTHGKIALVRNDRTDAAFARFSRVARGSRAHYASSFAEACAAVSENACEFCILPIENSTDGKLYSFYAMLDRYELKICAVAELDDDGGTTSTTFALVGRSIELHMPKNAPKRLELSVICESADAISDISAACRILGGKLCSVGTQALPYDDRGSRYYFAADFSLTSPMALSLFASLEYPRFTLVGLYTRK